MSYCGQNIFTSSSVRIKRNQTTFIRQGQLFFGLLFLIAFSLKVQGQTATISVNTTPVCQGSPEPAITFTGTDGNPEYTFNYIIDNGTTQSTLTTGTSIAGIINITIPTGSPGTYVYTLQSVTDNNNNTVDITGQSVTVVVNPLPTPTITANGSTTFNCPGERVTLSSSDPPPGGSYIYQWVHVSGLNTDITDIVDSTNSSIVATGGYRYAVRVTDNNGCIAISNIITVIQRPPPQPLNSYPITTAVTACVNYNPDSIFSPLPFGGITPYTYHWKENGIAVGINSPSYDPGNLAIAGIYVYNCEVTDACGSTITTVTQTITIIDPVSATISGGGNYCVADNIGLAVSLSNATSTYFYQWQSGTSINGPWSDIAGATNSTYSPSLTAGIYFYQIVVHSNEAPCDDETESVTVTVNALPAVTITGPASFCSGSNTLLTANATPGSGSISTYRWNLNGAAIAGATSSSYPAAIAGNYSVTVTNSNGCKTTSAVMIVTETALPPAPGVTVIDNCDATSTLTATGFTGSLLWSTNATSTSITVNTAATYTVTQTVNGCTSTTGSGVAAPNTNPVVTTPVAYCQGSIASPLTATATGSSTLLWYTVPTGGTGTTTAPIPSTATVGSTTYYVSQVTPLNCESSRSSITVMVSNQSPQGDLSSIPPVCYGNNSGTLTLTNNTGTVVSWESSTNGGATWTTINNTMTSFSYSNLTQTTIYRVQLQLNGCTGYSATGIVPVSPLFIPAVSPTTPVICLGQSAVLTASDYGQLPLSLEDFQNANPAGWSGNDANNNNQHPNSDWGESAQSGKVFNGIPYSSNAPPLSTKFMIVTGTTDGADRNAGLITAPFSLAGTINPIFNYWTALNFNAGTIGKVEISVDGGISYNTLKTYTGPLNVGNPNMGWAQEAINLSAYIGQANVRVRFNYTGTAGSNWAVDNVGIATTFQPLTYQWSPTTYLNPASGIGKTVTATPTVAGTFPYCVVATSAAGCVSPPVCVDVNVRPLPVCNIDGATTVCPGSLNIYTGPANAGYSYQWSVSGSASISGSNSGQTVTVLANSVCGSYIVTLRTTVNGCTGNPCTFLVNVVDVTSPVITCPAHVAVNCTAAVPAAATNYASFIAAGGTATDNCSLNPVITFVNDIISNQVCANKYTITRTYRATDNCGNASTCVQIITVNLPVFTGPANNSSIVACPAAAVTPILPVVNDACGNAIIPILVSVADSPAPMTCSGTRIYTYSYTDCVGNTATWTYTYIISAPTVILPPDGASTVACPAEAMAPTLPTVTDNCGRVMISSVPVISADPACGGIKTYTYTYTDCNGTAYNWTYTYTISPPAILMPANGASTIPCLANAVAPIPPVVIDNCGGVITTSGPVISEDPVCNGTKIYTYTYTDCNGTSYNWVYTYTIAAPAVVLPANGTATVACPFDAIIPTPPVVIDNCGRPIIPSAPFISIDPICSGTKTYTYNYLTCDNQVYTWTYTYTIAAHSVILPAFGSSTIACPADAVTPIPPVVTDNCGRIIIPANPVISADPVCNGIKTYTYAYTDCNGVAYNWLYTYTVLTAPAVTLPANGASTVTCLADAIAPIPPVVMDNCGRVIAPAAPVINADPVCNGIKTYTYTYTDCNGVNHDWVYTYTINRPAPIVSCYPTLTFCKELTDNYTVPVLVTSTGCNEALNISFQITGATIRNGSGNDASGIFNEGLSTITWTVVNGCQNTTCATTVMVNPLLQSDFTETACLTYSLPWGSAVTNTGDYTHIYQGVNGCDSVVTVHIKINPNVTGQQTITICEGQLPYTWNNQSITASGDYNATLASAAGCDSVATLHVIVNPNVTGQQTIAICLGQLPYTWNGQTLTTAGTTTATLQNINGCDSIVTLSLIVNPNVTGQQTITICTGQL
ncbi:MAG: hypothetical protein ABI675_16995, partial [Chitinophagaceae bacterium]